MISRYEAVLNGKQLSAVNKNLLILDIRHTEPERKLETVQLGSGDGLFVLGSHTESAGVQIDFQLRIYDTATRMKALQAVITWARKGGILTVSDRKDQQLHVVMDKAPVISSAMRWLDTLTVSFKAYGVPYWENIEETKLSLTGKTATGTLKIPGNGGDAMLHVTVTPKAAMTSLKVTCGSRAINLTELSVPKGTVVTIGYNDKGIFEIKAGTESLLAKRSAASADDLRAACGSNTKCTVTSNASCTTVISGRGLWV